MRPQLTRLYQLAIGVTSSLLLAAAAGAVGIERLGTLPGAAFSEAVDLSDDGTIVVGNNGSGDNFFWRRGFGINALPDRILDSDYRVTAISGDGTTVVGFLDPSSTTEAFRWHLSSQPQELPAVPTGSSNERAVATSSDGGVVVGNASVDDLNVHQAGFRWTALSGTVALGPSPTGTALEVSDVSADGQTILAAGLPAREIYRVDADGQFSQILGTDGGPLRGRAEAISADGSTVVGLAFEGLGLTTAYRQVGDRPAESLGLSFRARGVSDGGRVVVGDGGILWTESSGPRLLYDVLQDEGVDVSEWQSLDRIVGISPDGRWVTGSGVTTDATLEAFLIELPPSIVPEPAAATVVFATSVILLRRMRCVR